VTIIREPVLEYVETLLGWGRGVNTSAFVDKLLEEVETKLKCTEPVIERYPKEYDDVWEIRWPFVISITFGIHEHKNNVDETGF
jgi:hypothetical protein